MSGTPKDATEHAPLRSGGPSLAIPPLALVALGALYTIWGSTYLALRWLVAEVPAMLAAGARFVLAGSVLFVLGQFFGPTATPAKAGSVAPARGGGPPLVVPLAVPLATSFAYATVVGTLMFVVGNGFVSLAERDVSSGLAAVVCGTMPLFAALFGSFVSERPKPREVLGLGLGFAGVAVVGAGSLSASFLSATLLFLAQIGWAIGSLLNRKLASKMGTGARPAALQMIGGGSVAILVAFAKGERIPSSLPSPLALGSFAYLCVFGSIVAFSAYTYLLRTVSPALATSYAYVTPVVAVALGAALGREHIDVFTLLGGALAAVGVAIVLAQQREAGRTNSAGQKEGGAHSPPDKGPR